MNKLYVYAGLAFLTALQRQNPPATYWEWWSYSLQALVAALVAAKAYQSDPKQP